MSNRPLLMIPGPIEISENVSATAGMPPRGHQEVSFLDAMGSAIEKMRRVWLAGDDSQPFVIPGSGTVAMDMVVHNVVNPGDTVLLVHTGYFSERMRVMLERRGAITRVVRADPGKVPSIEELDDALEKEGIKVVFATHVDTSTGVRVGVKAICALARRHGVLSVFDGVCATAGERFHMEEWAADVYLTASQKAIGLPAGLALIVASPAALRARESLAAEPPLSFDWKSWKPIMEAYENRKPSYFSTPATTLVAALDVGLSEILAGGTTAAEAMEARFLLHERGAVALRCAWDRLGLRLLPESLDVTSNLLSALYYPEGVGPELLGRILERGVLVAGGLLPELKTKYFRVGHMGNVIDRKEDLAATVRAVGEALIECGAPVDLEGALEGLAFMNSPG